MRIGPGIARLGVAWIYFKEDTMNKIETAKHLLRTGNYPSDYFFEIALIRAGLRANVRKSPDERTAWMLN